MYVGTIVKYREYAVVDKMISYGWFALRSGIKLLSRENNANILLSKQIFCGYPRKMRSISVMGVCKGGKGRRVEWGRVQAVFKLKFRFRVWGWRVVSLTTGAGRSLLTCRQGCNLLPSPPECRTLPLDNLPDYSSTWKPSN